MQSRNVYYSWLFFSHFLPLSFFLCSRFDNHRNLRFYRHNLRIKCDSAHLTSACRLSLLSSRNDFLTTFAQTAWLVSNRKESMALAIGNTYWKGVFAQCMSRGHRHFHCDNYEVPWFLFDSVVLSVRSLMVLAMVFIVFGTLLSIIKAMCGGFSHGTVELGDSSSKLVG